MSLLPFLLNELMDISKRPILSDLCDQHFGIGLSDPFFHPADQAFLPAPLRAGYIRPWRHTKSSESGVSNLSNDESEFKVNLDVQQFKPEELNVTVDKGFLVVDGKHEERSDEHGFVSRQFTRKYKIPEDVDPEALVSKLSSDGVLSLQAPKMIKKDENMARQIPITHTNQPIRIKEQEQKDPKKESKETN